MLEKITRGFKGNYIKVFRESRNDEYRVHNGVFIGKVMNNCENILEKLVKFAKLVLEKP